MPTTVLLFAALYRRMPLGQTKHHKRIVCRRQFTLAVQSNTLPISRRRNKKAILFKIFPDLRVI